MAAIYGSGGWKQDPLPSATTHNEQFDEELRKEIVSSLSRAQVQNVDVMGEATIEREADHIMRAVSHHTKEAVEAELKTLDERLQYHIDESVKTEKKADKPWEKGGFPLLAESTRAGRLGWVQAQRLVKERIAELSAPQQSSSPDGSDERGGQQ